MGKSHHHDHAHSHQHTMAEAEALCADKGLRLTDLRRHVLETLIDQKKALGAYDLIEALADKGQKRLAPISIYRALDFLLEAGLAHKIESRNAFIACPHRHHANETVMFLICNSCGRVEEASSDALSGALATLASQRHFAPRSQVVEVHGTCVGCGTA